LRCKVEGESCFQSSKLAASGVVLAGTDSFTSVALLTAETVSFISVALLPFTVGLFLLASFDVRLDPFLGGALTTRSSSGEEGSATEEKKGVCRGVGGEGLVFSDAFLAIAEKRDARFNGAGGTGEGLVFADAFLAIAAKRGARFNGAGGEGLVFADVFLDPLVGEALTTGAGAGDTATGFGNGEGLVFTDAFLDPLVGEALTTGAGGGDAAATGSGIGAGAAFLAAFLDRFALEALTAGAGAGGVAAASGIGAGLVFLDAFAEEALTTGAATSRAGKLAAWRSNFGNPASFLSLLTSFVSTFYNDNDNNKNTCL
jgi:hypothetical protein